MSKGGQSHNLRVEEEDDDDSSFASDKMEAIDEMDGGLGSGILETGSLSSRKQVIDKKKAR